MGSHYRDGSVASAGVVEIGTIPRMFYTPAYGAPDILFHWLLTNAREAFAVAATTVQHQGEPPKDVSFYAATYMAGVLLRDENLVPARVQNTSAHLYTLDFLADTIQLRTEIYAVQQHSSALFTVKIDGRIKGSAFVVRNAVTDRVLAQVTEEELKKPNFFTDELPSLCYHVQQDPGLAASVSTAALVDQSLELRLSIPPVGEVKSILVQKDKGQLQGQVRDAETGQSLCVLPLDSLNNLGQMVETLQRILLLAKATPRVNLG